MNEIVEFVTEFHHLVLVIRHSPYIRIQIIYQVGILVWRVNQLLLTKELAIVTLVNLVDDSPVPLFPLLCNPTNIHIRLAHSIPSQHQDPC